MERRVTQGRRPVVLVVEDDHALRRSLERSLDLEGFETACASGGRAALAAVDDVHPEAILLDVAMPDLDGREVSRRLRGRGVHVPICMLSARGDVAERIAGLRAGADDYVVKPFAVEEVVARLRALLRRTAEPPPRPLRVADLELDPARRTVRRGRRPVQLTAREFDLLHALLAAGDVVSRAELLRRVWGFDFDARTNVLDVYVGYLRRKLEEGGEPRLVQTVRGAGFAVRP